MLSRMSPDPRTSAVRQRRDAAAWIGLAARLVLAVVWLWAGGAKLFHLDESVQAVRGYQILPYQVALVVGYALPMLEVLLGLLLLAGLLTRWAGAASALLLLAFIIGIASAWARGLSIDCGCFGGGGQITAEEAARKYPWEIARDTGLLLLGLWLVWRPRTRFSLDEWLFGVPAYADQDQFDEDPADEPHAADPTRPDIPATAPTDPRKP